MRLRIHDDGRWAVHTGAGEWLLFRDGVRKPHGAVELHEDGWHEAVVLDADRLERELRALVPAAISVSLGQGEPSSAIAQRVLRVVMTCVRINTATREKQR
jgi:hypothetical protein